MSPEAAPRVVPCAASLTFDEAFALMMSQVDPLEISEVPLAEAFRDALQAKGIQPCIPSRRSRNKPVRYDRRRYRRRSRIEIMFGRLKDGRRVATRYDRCPTAFLLRRQPGRHCHLLALINES